MDLETPSGQAVGLRKLCRACGRTWKAHSGERRSVASLFLRRLARHSGVRAAWAHPRPEDRCPSCYSRQVGEVRTLEP